MRNKFFFSATFAACLAALAADAKTVVTPIARTLSPATYYSANTIVVPGITRPSDLHSIVYTGARSLDDGDDCGALIVRPKLHFPVGFHSVSNPLHATNLESMIRPGAPPVVSPPAVANVDIRNNSASTVERTRPRYSARKLVATDGVPSLDELVTRQRVNHEKQLAKAKKRRVPGRHEVLPFDRNSVRVCIAARPTRVPRAAHRAVPQHIIASKCAMPLTTADIERKNEQKREYRLGYARKSKHLRRLSPDRIAKLKFFPPLRRFDTDVLIAASAPAPTIMAYEPASGEDIVIYASNTAAGVQKYITITAGTADEIIGQPSQDVCIAGVSMKGNVPAKTGANGVFYAAAETLTFKSKTKRGFLQQSVALRNIPRGGLHQVTYDELGHSPPGIRA